MESKSWEGNRLSILFWLLAVVICHVFLHRGLGIQHRISSEEVYYEPILFTQFPLIYLSVLFFLTVSLWKSWTWKGLLKEKNLSLLVRVLVLFVSWDYLFYDYNFYFNQWHAYDRLLLALFAGLSMRYPLLIIPTLMQINLLHHQFNFPIGALSFLDKIMPYELLAVFSSFLLILCLVRVFNQRKEGSFPEAPANFPVYLLLVVAAACYYHSGLEKAAISPHGWEWAFDNRISNNITAMKNRGWLESVSGIQHLVYRLFSSIEIPAQILVFAGELAFIALLFSRLAARWLLILMFVLHLGVFLMNGAFFWIWMIADIGLFLLLKKGLVTLIGKPG